MESLIDKKMRQHARKYTDENLLKEIRAVQTFGDENRKRTSWLKMLLEEAKRRKLETSPQTQSEAGEEGR